MNNKVKSQNITPQKIPIKDRVPNNNNNKSPFALPSSNFTFHFFFNIKAVIENGNIKINDKGNAINKSMLKMSVANINSSIKNGIKRMIRQICFLDD